MFAKKNRLAPRLMLSQNTVIDVTQYPQIYKELSPVTACWFTVNMESADLTPLIEILDDNIDDLEEALAPLLKVAMSDTAGKLPLLDKAHLYVLVTYAIESILFCMLRHIKLNLIH